MAHAMKLLRQPQMAVAVKLVISFTLTNYEMCPLNRLKLPFQPLERVPIPKHFLQVMRVIIFPKVLTRLGKRL